MRPTSTLSPPVAPPPSPMVAVPTAAAVAVALVDAVLTVAVPLAALSVVALVVWAATGAGTLLLWARAGADLWLSGHGVGLQVAASPGVPAFPLTVAALGGACLTLAGGVRAGRRLAATRAPVAGGVVALLVTAGLGGAVGIAAEGAPVAPVLWQAAALPPAWLLAGMLAGGGVLRRIRAARPVLGGGLAAGAGAAVALVGAGAVAVAVLLFTGLPSVVGIAEAVHTGVDGGLALTVAQLALLPTLAVWALSWFAGPGFAVGAGTAVGPFGTHLGALPAVPVLGALPTASPAWAVAGLAVPLAAGFLCGALARRHAPVRSGAALPVGLIAGVTAGALAGVLACLASGSAGPGRLAEVGPDALAVAAAVAAEVAVAVALGFATGRPAPAPEPEGWHLPEGWQIFTSDGEHSS